MVPDVDLRFAPHALRPGLILPSGTVLVSTPWAPIRSDFGECIMAAERGQDVGSQGEPENL